MQYAVGGILERFSIPERSVFVHWAQAIAEAGVVDRKGCQANERVWRCLQCSKYAIFLDSRLLSKSLWVRHFRRWHRIPALRNEILSLYLLHSYAICARKQREGEKDAARGKARANESARWTICARLGLKPRTRSFATDSHCIIVRCPAQHLAVSIDFHVGFARWRELESSKPNV